MEDRVATLERKIRRLVWALALVGAIALAAAGVAAATYARAPATKLSFRGDSYALDIDPSGIIMKNGERQLALSASTLELRSEKGHGYVALAPGMVRGGEFDASFDLGAIEGIAKLDVSTAKAKIEIGASNLNGASAIWIADDDAGKPSGSVLVMARDSDASVTTKPGTEK